MRRERLLTLLGGGLLAALALAEGEPVRRAALAVRTVASTGWDAAAHALLGLDLFDNLARLRPGAFLTALVSEHWWPPLFGLVSVPFQILAGPSFAAASLPSAVAFALTPTVAFLLVRRLTGAGATASLLAFVLVAFLFLRSPMLLEMSTWPMFESLGGLLALVAWLFFADRADPRSLKAAAFFGALLFFLKVHFGFFGLATFAAVLVLDEPRESRRELRRALVDLLVRPIPFAAAGLIAALWIGRVVAEARTPDPPFWLPSRGNLCYAAFLFLLVWGALQPERRRALGAALGPSLSTFVRWGLFAPAVWLLVPGNVRAWYRQTIQNHPDPERNPLRQLAACFSFLRDEYTWNVPDALPLVLVAIGLAAVLAPARDRDRTAAPMAWFAVWPALLMSLNTWRVEARYLGVLVPSLFAVSAAGLLLLFARIRPSARPAVTLLAACRCDRLRGEGTRRVRRRDGGARGLPILELAGGGRLHRRDAPRASRSRPDRRRASRGATYRACAPPRAPPRPPHSSARRRPRRAREPGEAPVAPSRAGSRPGGDRRRGVVRPARPGVALSDGRRGIPRAGSARAGQPEDGRPPRRRRAVDFRRCRLSSRSSTPRTISTGPFTRSVA